MTASNFAHLEPDFPAVHAAASSAERLAMSEPEAAAILAGKAVELALGWAFAHDAGLTPPAQTGASRMINDPDLRTIMGQKVHAKARFINLVRNKSAHEGANLKPEGARQVVEELHHVLHWFGRTYARRRKPPEPNDFDPAPLTARLDLIREARGRIQSTEKALEARNEELEDLRARYASLDEELKAKRAEVANARLELKTDPHDYNEATTRLRLIDLLLAESGWTDLKEGRDLEYRVEPMPNEQGHGFADYVLWGADGLPLAVVEAKRTRRSSSEGQQQAKLYADALEQMHGRRPVIFYTNGYEHWIWDDARGIPPRRLGGFKTAQELGEMIARRTEAKALVDQKPKAAIAGRPYQTRALTRIAEHFDAGSRKALLVMATGTGKTRTVISLVDMMVRAGLVKRALFLCDRISLVRQARNAFAAHMPDSSPVNLVTDPSGTGRVYVSTYPTMMNLIDRADHSGRRFGPGHFDLVIIDEAHRSIYKRYRAIFEWFDSYLVGLTATPRDEVDRDTYRLFDLDPGHPTDFYGLEEAIEDGFLVPFEPISLPTRFMREGKGEAEAFFGTLLQGMWNGLSEHQKRSDPFKLVRVKTAPASHEYLGRLARVRREELDGFIDGLFAGQEEMNFPESAHNAIETLGEMRALRHFCCADIVSLGAMICSPSGYHRLSRVSRQPPRLGHVRNAMDTSSRPLVQPTGNLYQPAHNPTVGFCPHSMPQFVFDLTEVFSASTAKRRFYGITSVVKGIGTALVRRGADMRYGIFSYAHQGFLEVEPKLDADGSVDLGVPQGIRELRMRPPYARRSVALKTLVKATNPLLRSLNRKAWRRAGIELPSLDLTNKTLISVGRPKMMVDAIHALDKRGQSFDLIALLHDMFPLHPEFGHKSASFPGKFLDDNRIVIERASHLLSNSEFTGNDIRAFAAEGILPHPPPITTIPLVHECAPGDAPATLELPSRPYLLTVGATIGRKNLEASFAALGILKDQGAALPHLVIAGPTRRTTEKHLELARYADIRDKIIFIPSVPQQDLKRLYENALALVMASRMEGWGLPAGEALWCGTPVLCSTAPVLREVCGDLGLYFEPDDPAQLANHVRKLMRDDVFLSELRTRIAAARVNLRTWDDVAKDVEKTLAGIS